jgi:D-inositol-3-phosphate glycosyltransferase
MRIAMISEHASPAALLGGEDAGGQNVYVDEISRELARLGFWIDIFTRRDSPHVPLVQPWAPGVRIVNLNAGPARYVPKDDLWPLMPSFRDELLRFIDRDGARYDVVHGNFWMSGWVACELQSELGAPAVQLFHALGATKRRHQGGADTSPPARLQVEREIVRRVERVIATCPHEINELVEDYDAARSWIEMIPLGVDGAGFRPIDQASARQAFGLDLDLKVIVYVGRILPRKDVRNVVRALALLKLRTPELGERCRLVIVGGESREPDPARTPELGELMRLSYELDVTDEVIFTGKRAKDELRLCYSAGDLAVTTPWYEPFGLTPLEAMACGRPVIGADVGGIAFTVAHGETGLLVPPRDPNALADSIAELLTDPERCTVLGGAARRRVETEFTWRRVAEQTAALYREVSRPVRLVVPGRASYEGDRAAAGD